MIKEAPEVKKKQLLEMIVQLVRVDLTKPLVVNKSSDRVTTYAAYALVAAGAEQAMLDAFKDNLDNTRLGELMSIVESLAACRGEGQTDIIERLAKDRLAILGDTLITSEIEEERYTRNDLLGSFVKILMGLASSANPSGMERAKKIRDEFAVLYPSDNGKRVLAAIDADLAKIAPPQPATIEEPDTGRESSPLGGKSSPIQNAPEAAPVAQSEKPISLTTWSVSAILIVAGIGLLWFLLKRRS